MDSIIFRLLFNNWQRKCLAIVSAIVIWFFVNHSITATKTIPHVPIRIVNIPQGKTVQGLLPNGILAKRVTLTLNGKKGIVDQLEPGDIEVHIDALNNPDEWIIQVNKKNLVSLNPDLDLSHNISQITHNEFVIKMSKLISAQIPITVSAPNGEPPKGYQFLDIWPQYLLHSVSGPEDQVQALRNKGIELAFNLNEITKADLDALSSNDKQGNNDEVSYTVPNKWKQVAIPFLNNASEEINDTEAQKLHINFLRQELIPIQGDIPVQVFFPGNVMHMMNPDTHSLATNAYVYKKNGVYLFSMPLYTLDVSKVFLDTVRDHMQISIIATPQDTKNTFHWSLEFINPRELEDRYVKAMTSHAIHKGAGELSSDSREEHLRLRFREYMQKFALYTQQHQKLNLKGKFENKQIVLSVDTKDPLSKL